MDPEASLKPHRNDEQGDEAPEPSLITLALFTYNQEGYVRQAIESAFNQTYQRLEIILSDDFSTDRTFTIMRAMAESYRGPHSIILDRTENNTGKNRFGKRVWDVLRKCRGELIVLAAGDDISIKTRCQDIYETWTQRGKPKASLHSLAVIIDERGRRIESNIGDNKINSFSVSELIANDGRGLLGATHAIHRALVEEFPPFSRNIRYEDGALALRAKLSDGIILIEKPLVMYRRHSQNITNTRELNNSSDYANYIHSLFGMHATFLNDYLTKCKHPDARVLAAVEDRLRSLRRMKSLFNGNKLQQIRAMFEYGKRLPLKRRVWLLLWKLGLINSC